MIMRTGPGTLTDRRSGLHFYRTGGSGPKLRTGPQPDRIGLFLGLVTRPRRGDVGLDLKL